MENSSSLDFAKGVMSEIINALPTVPDIDGCRIWSDGDLIFCKTQEGAKVIADLIDALYKAHVSTTGYFDPAEYENTEYSGAVGWYYVDIV